jgi:ABC-type transport system involved in cytochrome bd biosynthesis fused ATPase/permease subunit
MAPEIIVAIIGVAGVIASAICSAVVTYKIAASKVREEEQRLSALSQQSMNESFRLLVQAYHEDRTSMRQEMAELKEDVLHLANHVVRLEAELARNGHIIPPRPARAARSAAA